MKSQTGKQTLLPIVEKSKAGTVKAGTVKAGTVKADTVKADTIKANTRKKQKEMPVTIAQGIQEQGF